MLFRTPGPAFLIAHERHSRITLAIPQPSLRAQTVAECLTRLLEPLAPELRQSITFDNGGEFYRHHLLASQLSIHTYFCDPRAPWQKGGIENAIGRLRRALPTKINPTELLPQQLDAILANYNNTPRKCLGFKTPAETFNPLHFECESTPGSSPG